jgi:hypothetical protein
MHRPVQNAEKLPATRPERMLSEAPPCLEEVTTSLTWRLSVEVKILVNSGMRAPATVPQRDDGGEHPPEVGQRGAGVVAHPGEQQVAGGVGDEDGDDGGDPDEVGQRVLEVEVFRAAPDGLGDGVVHPVGNERGDDHQDAHGEEPDDEGGAERGAGGEGEGEEGDERDAGHAVGLEAVGGGSDGVAGVVSGAVGDDAGVAGVVLGELEDDLHEVGADVGDLGEDAAADAEGGGAEGLADGEADEAGAGELAGEERQDADHEEELDRRRGAGRRSCRTSAG